MTAQPVASWPTTNRRLLALLDYAVKAGLDIPEQSENVRGAWSVRWLDRLEDGTTAGEVVLTFFEEENHAVRVYLDAPWLRDWAQITQKEARALMASARKVQGGSEEPRADDA